MGNAVARNRLIGAFVVAACLAASTSYAIRTSTLSVTADVSPSAVFGAEFTSAPIVITKADVERGYIDVVMKSRMELRMPAAKVRAVPPVTMDVAAREDVFKSVNVAAQERGMQGTVETAEFRYRFELSDRARLGGYATSISLAIDL